MKPLITALVDTYNHEKYIEQALVAALEQGLPEVEPEIVVVDDGSTDKTVCDRSEVRAAGEACAEKEWRASVGFQDRRHCCCRCGDFTKCEIGTRGGS